MNDERGEADACEIYCDESGVERFYADEPGEGYALIGSLWLHPDERGPSKQAIAQLREQHNVFGEFKWNRVSASREGFYTDLVDLFFYRPLRFRCIVVAASEVDPAKFHADDRELMFYKFYFQLLHHWIQPGVRYRAFVDDRTDHDRTRRSTLRDVLRNANREAVIESVQALPSDELDLLQLADVLLGAVSYQFHGHVPASRRTPSEDHSAKAKVVRAIQSRSGGRLTATSRSEPKFNVFRFRGEDR